MAAASRSDNSEVARDSVPEQTLPSALPVYLVFMCDANANQSLCVSHMEQGTPDSAH